MNNCDVVKDLLPLYHDKVVSEDSRAMIEEHLKNCPDCRELSARMQNGGAQVQLKFNVEIGALKIMKRKILRKNFLIACLSVVLTVLLIVLAGIFVADGRIVPSGAMLPTIEPGDRVCVLKLPYILGAVPKLQEMVVFTAPEEFGVNDDLLKRVIGLPGDTVEIKDGLVYVNGVALDEPYILEPSHRDFPQVTVPESCYFMLGDNRNHSRDSIMWQDPFVPLSSIKGKVVLRYWPLAHWGRIR